MYQSRSEETLGVKKTMSKPESIHKFPFEYVPELLPAATHSLTVPTSTRNDTHTFSSVHLVEKVFVIRPMMRITRARNFTFRVPARNLRVICA